MDDTRRRFLTLLALTPLALVVKPAKAEYYTLGCDTCGDEVCQLKHYMWIKQHGKVLCAKHYDGKNGLIRNFVLDVDPLYMEEYRRDCEVLSI